MGTERTQHLEEVEEDHIVCIALGITYHCLLYIHELFYCLI